MPIFSYLAYPVEGAKHALQRDLEVLDYCDVLPSDSEEVLVLVTDTPDEQAEKELKDELGRLQTLQSLGMTFGHVADGLPEEAFISSLRTKVGVGANR